MAQLLLALGASTGAVSTVSTIASIAAPVLSVVGAISQVKAAKEQAAEHEREAAEHRIMAGVEAERARRRDRQIQSASRVSMLEGGALSGTAQGVLDQNAVAQELDALTVEFQGEQKARGAEFRAAQAKRGASPLSIFSAAVKGFSAMDPLNVSN